MYYDIKHRPWETNFWVPVPPEPGSTCIDTATNLQSEGVHFRISDYPGDREGRTFWILVEKSVEFVN